MAYNNPSAPPAYNNDAYQLNAKIAQFNNLVHNLGIEPKVAGEVRYMLCGSKKVVIIDNSPSMNRAIHPDATHLNSAQFGGVIRRIDELKALLKEALPILAVDSPGGVDVWWLNDPYGCQQTAFCRENIHSYSDIQLIMDMALPKGSTPLLKTLINVLDKYTRADRQEQYMHCMVFLDGEPDGGKYGKRECTDLVRNRPHPLRNIMNWVACTDNDDEIKWVNAMDRFPGIDIVDDFNSERREIMRAGKTKSFSYADYVVKACIGAASPVINGLDEPTFMRRIQLALMCK